MKQHTLDRIISDVILSDTVLPNHRLCKIDGTLYMDNVTTLYFDNLTIEYSKNRDTYFIKTTYHYTDTIRKEFCHTNTYFKLINIKRKNFIRNLVYNLIGKQKLKLVKPEKLHFYNIAFRQGKLEGYSHTKEAFRIYLDYIKPQYLDEFLPIEVSLGTQEMVTMDQLDVIKYLVKNVL